MSTLYQSSKGPVEIDTMPLSYAKNALNKLRRGEPERVAEIEALDAHVMQDCYRKGRRAYGERELSQLPHKDGYLTVRLTIEGRRKRYAVHRLVAAAHLPARPSSAHQVRHLDGDMTNNRASNLAWGTAQDNADDRQRHGRTSRGPAFPMPCCRQ